MTNTAIDSRTDAEVMADVARRRDLRILAEAAGAYEYQASISMNGGSVSNANKFTDRARAIRRAMSKLETEGTTS